MSSKKRSKKRVEEEVDDMLDFDADDQPSDESLGEDDNKKVSKTGSFNSMVDHVVKSWLGGPAIFLYTKAANFLVHFKAPIYYGWIPLVLYFGIRGAPAGEMIRRALSVAMPMLYLEPIPEGEEGQLFMPGGRQALQGDEE